VTDQEILSLVRSALNEVVPGRAEEFERLRLDVKIRDLGIDSVATMEMVGCIEEEIGATFPDEELSQLTRFEDLATLIRKTLA